MKKASYLLTISLIFGSYEYSFAGKKALIWDDTETVGKGNYQVENYFFYTKDVEEKEGSYIFNFTFGYNDKTDLAVNIPFGYLKTYENTYSDISDPFFEIKYRFYEKDNLKFSIKPFISIPVKKESKFSCKEISYGLTLTGQLKEGKFSFYSNTSFMVHQNRISGENEFFQSISTEYSIKDNFSVIGSLYLSSYGETKKGGVIGFGYFLGKMEIGFGIGKRFDSKNDFSIYSGITVKFY